MNTGGDSHRQRNAVCVARLAVWWMKLGIVPERIAAGHPEQNGRHERMHRTAGSEIGERSSGHLIGFGASTTRSVRMKR